MEKYPGLKSSDLYNSAFVWFNTDNAMSLRLASAARHAQDGTVQDHQIDNLLGSVFTKHSHFNPTAAVGLLKGAVSAAPDVEAYKINLALALMLAGEAASAESVAREVLAVNPSSLDAYTQLFSSQLHQGKYREGNQTHAEMQRLFPGDESNMAKGLSDMLVSDMKDSLPYNMGIKNNQGRYSKPNYFKIHSHVTGNELRQFRGGTLNVYLEQGLGDAVMMIPYLVEVMARVGCLRIISVDHDPAIDLYEKLELSRSDKALLVRKEDNQWYNNSESWDTEQCWLFDLLVLGLPGEICNPQPVCGNPDGKIGICWRGNKRHPNDLWRSIQFADIKDFIQKYGPRLYCLQADLTPEEHAFCKSAGVEMSAEGSDFGKLIEIMKGLRSVVTVDTFIGHLAGTLGVPCFTLLAVNVDWRWGMSDNKTPWYSNHTLLRQKKCQNWKDPLNELESLI